MGINGLNSTFSTYIDPYSADSFFVKGLNTSDSFDRFCQINLVNISSGTLGFEDVLGVIQHTPVPCTMAQLQFWKETWDIITNFPLILMEKGEK